MEVKTEEMRKKNLWPAVLVLALIMTGCGTSSGAVPEPEELLEEAEEVRPEEAEEQEAAEEAKAPEEEPEAAEGSKPAGEEPEAAEGSVPAGEEPEAAEERAESSEGPKPAEEPTETEAEPGRENAASNGRLVVIDAGHQQKGNSEKEPVGPGASQMKAKVAGGTSGRASGLKEYELTLQVAQRLEEILKERGYEVIMVRTEHDVNISNAERAAVANEAGADVFLRIHANGSENGSVHGAMTICQTPSNPYNGALYEESRSLADSVLDAFVEKTGAKKQYVWETDTMSGINWASVPVTIVEMGYMTNEEEDLKMASEDYQVLMAEGLADGIGDYLGIE